MIAILAALALVMAMVAACGGDDDGDSGTASTSTTTTTSSSDTTAAVAPTDSGSASMTMAQPAATAEAAMPDTTQSGGDAMMGPKVDRVVVGTQQPSLISNNVGKGLSPQSQIQLVPMYEYMIGTDAQTGALVPQLATEWSVEPNGQDFRITLREGVPFHGENGTLSYRDVERTLAELSAEDSEHTHARDYRKATIEPVSDLEFIWKLTTPVAEQVRRFSEQVGGLEIMSAADYEKTGPPDFDTGPTAGTAGYEFLSREQNVGIVFKSVDYDHWRHNPDFPELEIRWMNEESTRLASLLTGEIHITQLGADSTEQASADGMKVETGTLPGARIFGAFRGGYLDITYSFYEAQNTPCQYVHCDSPWLDPRVRKAMNKAIDKAVLNDAFFRNAAQPMVIQAIPETSPAFSAAWRDAYDTEYGYDPAEAHALLDMAGYDERNPLQINVDAGRVAAYPQAQDVMEAMAGMWNDIGVKTELQVVDPAVQRPRSRGLELVDWVGLTATASFDVQSFRVHHAARTPRGGGFEPLEIHELINTLQVTMDPTAQDALLREIGDIAFPRHIAINLFWVPPQIVLNPEFVESFGWPGNISGLWSHFDLIRANKG